MKFDLFEKAVESLNYLKNTEEYGLAAPKYSVMLTQDDNLYVFNRESETVILEIKDEHTIINHCPCPHDGGYHFIWEKSIDIFREGLEKRLKHKVNIHTWHQMNLYEKAVEALRDLKREYKYKDQTKEYRLGFGTQNNVYVHDGKKIFLEIKDNYKVVNHGNSRFIDATWDAVVKIFETSLKEKMGD